MKTIMTVVAAMATLATVPAAAVSIVGATKIEVKSALPDYLQVAELQAFNFASTNVALAANGGTATGSSTYFAYSSPDKAIDGNTGGGFYTDKIFHSSGTGGGEFLDVNFAATSLSSISIFGRSDCCSQRDLYTVTVFNAAGNTLYSGQINADNQAHSGTLTFTAASVPEPASWVLMVGGFGLVGFAARRRSTAVAA
jgi:hypothetical protein